MNVRTVFPVGVCWVWTSTFRSLTLYKNDDVRSEARKYYPIYLYQVLYQLKVYRYIFHILTLQLNSVLLSSIVLCSVVLQTSRCEKITIHFLDLMICIIAVFISQLSNVQR